MPLLTPRTQPQLNQFLHPHLKVPESCPFCVEVPTHSILGDTVLGFDLHFQQSQIPAFLILQLNGKTQQGQLGCTGTQCPGYHGRPCRTCDGEPLNGAYCSLHPEPEKQTHLSVAFHVHTKSPVCPHQWSQSSLRDRDGCVGTELLKLRSSLRGIRAYGISTPHSVGSLTER